MKNQNSRNETIDLQVWVRENTDEAADHLLAILNLARYKMDIQYFGTQENENRRWRAFQNLNCDACTNGDLRQGYGATPEDAIAQCVEEIEEAERATH